MQTHFSDVLPNLSAVYSTGWSLIQNDGRNTTRTVEREVCRTSRLLRTRNNIPTAHAKIHWRCPVGMATVVLRPAMPVTNTKVVSQRRRYRYQTCYFHYWCSWWINILLYITNVFLIFLIYWLPPCSIGPTFSFMCHLLRWSAISSVILYSFMSSLMLSTT